MTKLIKSRDERMNALVLVFGSGLLGREFGDIVPNAIVMSHAECDITNYVAVEACVRRAANAVSADQKLVVVNAAAYTNADKAEVEPKQAFAVNALGAKNVASACSYVAGGTTFVHVSTNAVFDGLEGTFDETSSTQPASVYGYTKRVGEEFVIGQMPASLEPWYVVRTGFLYGKHGKNFGSKLFSRLKAGEQVHADRDRQVTPTWARFVAEAICEMVAEKVPSGIYHAISGGPTSWYHFVNSVAERMSGTIGPPAPGSSIGYAVSKSFVPGPGLAPRLHNSIMVSKKLPMFDIHMPHLHAGMCLALDKGGL